MHTDSTNEYIYTFLAAMMQHKLSPHIVTGFHVHVQWMTMLFTNHAQERGNSMHVYT